MVVALVFSKGVSSFQEITETVYDIFEDHFQNNIEFYKILGVKDDQYQDELNKRGKANAKAKDREKRLKEKNKTLPKNEQKNLYYGFRKDAYFESAFIRTEKNSEHTHNEAKNFGLSTRSRSNQLLFYLDKSLIAENTFAKILDEIDHALAMEHSTGRAKIYFTPCY